MIRYENHCCDCAVPGYPCEGSSCPYIDVPVYYCDICGYSTPAEYDIEGGHYCKECVNKYLDEDFKNLTISEQAEILNINLVSLEG